MGQEIAVPDWAKQAPAPAFAVLSAQDDNLAEGIGQSYAVIGYKGKVWSLRHRGERHNFVRPDDGTPSSYLDVIILGQAKSKSKSFYEKYDPNNSDGGRPICSSIDGLIPDPDVTRKQCDTCALCPRNEWKTDANGRKGRECTDYKRLAVLILPTMTKPILGEPLMEAVFLRVPPASLNSLAIMGDTMTAQGFHYSSYITRVSFDPNEAHPKMVFKPLQGLTDREAPTILKLRQDQTVGRITGGEFAGRLRPVQDVEVLPPGATVTGLSIAAQSTPQTISTTPSQTNGSVVKAASTPAPVSNGLGSAQPATNGAVQAASSAPQSATTVDTGFGIATPAQTQQVSALVAAANDDAGAPEATDADLDARIANLIKAS